LSDKYPNLSPYTYCADNPVKYIDPNGRDIWEVDKYGNINNVAVSSSDVFYKIDEKGNRIDVLSFEQKIVSADITIKKSHYLKIDNANNADAVFSFLSENAEMDGAEFSYSLVNDKEGNTFSLIGTDLNAQKGQTYSIPNLLQSETYTVLDCTHNHYAEKCSPSSNDVFYAQKYPQVNFSIRTKGDICTPYDGNTQPDYDMSKCRFPLEGITVKP
ncbi:MAG: hypothetical protein J6W84_05970, partial [Bacteroidales bacterium]|nr:hypothetical protein [Bacteroidales bacterium]